MNNSLLPSTKLAFDKKPQEQIEDPSWLGRALYGGATSIAGAIPKAAENLVNLADYFTSEEKLKQINPSGKPREFYGTPEHLRRSAEKKRGWTPGSLDPQGLLEKTVDKVVGTLPLLAISGARIIPSLVKEFLPTAAMTGAEELGAHPVLQIGAGIGTGWLQNKGLGLLKKGGNIGRIDEAAELAKNQYYKQESEIGSKINAPADKYQQGLDKITSEIMNNSALSTGDKNELVAKLGLYKGDMVDGTINASKLAQRDKELNSLWPSTQGAANRTYREYVAKIKKVMHEIGQDISNIGAEGKEWFANWQNGKDIVKAQNFKFEFADALERTPELAAKVSTPLLQKIFGLPGYVANIPIKLGAKAVGHIASKSLELGRKVAAFYEYPAGQKLIQEVMYNFLQDNANELSKSLTKLNRTAHKFEKNYVDKPIGKLSPESDSRPKGKLTAEISDRPVGKLTPI